MAHGALDARDVGRYGCDRFAVGARVVAALAFLGILYLRPRRGRGWSLSATTDDRSTTHMGGQGIVPGPGRCCTGAFSVCGHRAALGAGAQRTDRLRGVSVVLLDQRAWGAWYAPRPVMSNGLLIAGCEWWWCPYTPPVSPLRIPDSPRLSGKDLGR